MVKLRTRAEVLDDLEQQVRSSGAFPGERIVRTEHGFRLQETGTFTVEVWKMLDNAWGGQAHSAASDLLPRGLDRVYFGIGARRRFVAAVDDWLRRDEVADGR